MSAGSRKKHNNQHKQFAAGHSDHLEVQSLLAGAGNGRDVEEKLGGAMRITEDQKLKPEDLQFNGAESFGGGGLVEEPVGSGLIDEPIGSGLVLEDSIVGIGNEGPVSAGNADTSNNAEQEENNVSRISQAILDQSKLDPNAARPELDTSRESATPGYVPEYESFVANESHQGSNLIAVVTRLPKPELFGEENVRALKAVIELHAVEITGLRTGFMTFGNASANPNQLKESEAKITAVEKYGRPIDRLMHLWGRRWNDYLTAREKSVPVSQKKNQMQVEDVTVDVVFFEVDKSHTKVLAAWFGQNLHASDYSGIESYRELTMARPDGIYLEITLAGKYDRSDAIDALAQEELNKIIADGANPYERKAFVTAIDQDVTQGKAEA